MHRLSTLTLVALSALFATLIAPSARAADNCDNRGSSVSVVIDPKSGQALLNNRCDQTLRCEVCPVFGDEVSINGCRSVDLDPASASPPIDFGQRPSRVNRVCLVKESFDVCRGPTPQKAPEPPEQPEPVKPEPVIVNEDRSTADLPPTPDLDCNNRGSCLDAVIDAKSGVVGLKNKCEKTLRCELCPTFGTDVSIDGCQLVDLQPAADTIQVDFKRHPSRLNRVCLARDSFKSCRASPQNDEKGAAGSGPARVQSKQRTLQLQEERRKQRAFGALDNLHKSKYDRRNTRNDETREGVWHGQTILTIEGLGTFGYSSFSFDDGFASASVTMPSVGAGIRLAVVPVGVPNGDGTAYGFRFGAGAEPTMVFTSSTANAGKFGSTSTASSTFILKVPLFLGPQVMLGTYSSTALWKGVSLGIDYMPTINLSSSPGFTPVGINLHIASSTLRRPGTQATKEVHFDGNVCFSPAIGDRPWNIGFAFGAIWM
jgi:hypothetical protein